MTSFQKAFLSSSIDSTSCVWEHATLGASLAFSLPLHKNWMSYIILTNRGRCLNIILDLFQHVTLLAFWYLSMVGKIFVMGYYYHILDHQKFDYKKYICQLCSLDCFILNFKMEHIVTCCLRNQSIIVLHSLSNLIIFLSYELWKCRQRDETVLF